MARQEPPDGRAGGPQLHSVEMFCQYVASGVPLTTAYLRAGFKARSGFGSLARRPEVAKRIQDLIAHRLAVAGVTAERTKHEIARIAYFDIRRLFDDAGRLLPVHMLDDDTAAGISSIQVESRRVGTTDDGQPIFVDVRKIKVAPKMDALTLLAKHFKVIGDEAEGVNNLANALAERLNSAKQRARHPHTEEPVEDARYTPTSPTQMLPPGHPALAPPSATTAPSPTDPSSDPDTLENLVLDPDFDPESLDPDPAEDDSDEDLW